MMLSATLAGEYVLIVPFDTQLQFGRQNKSQQKNITSTALTLLCSGSGDESRNISTAESPDRKAKATS